jgi:hypothetical protein
MPRSALALLLLAAWAPGLTAQTVQGRLTDPTGEPVPSALITLLHAKGAAERPTVSDPRGNFTLDASTHGSITLRIERPGYQPFTSQPLALPAAGLTALTLVVDAERRSLEGVRASAGTCQAGAASGIAADLWQQATRALAIMALAEEGGMLAVQGIRYLRLLDGAGDLQYGILEQEGFAGRSVPYPAPPVPELPLTGFTETDDAGVVAYHVPSPAMLLSPSFLAAHCVDRVVVDRRRRGDVGLSIRPVTRSAFVGIEGVLWLDRASGDVSAIEYAYRDSRGVVPRGARGLISFRRGSGAMPQVSRWWVRVPRTFETRYAGGDGARAASTLESGAFVLGANLEPLDDPDGVFALLTGTFMLDPISVEAERAQRTMTEGALRQIRLDEMLGAQPTDALEIVSSMRPGWLARAQAWRLAEEDTTGGGGDFADGRGDARAGLH